MQNSSCTHGSLLSLLLFWSRVALLVRNDKGDPRRAVGRGKGKKRIRSFRREVPVTKVRPKLWLAILLRVGEHDPLQDWLVTFRNPQLGINQIIAYSDMITRRPTNRGIFYIVRFLDFLLQSFGQIVR